MPLPPATRGQDAAGPAETALTAGSTTTVGDAGHDAAWSETIQRCMAAIADGSATVVPWSTARQQIAGDELGEALDVGIAGLDRGQGIESSIEPRDRQGAGVTSAARSSTNAVDASRRGDTQNRGTLRIDPLRPPR